MIGNNSERRQQLLLQLVSTKTRARATLIKYEIASGAFFKIKD